MLATETSHARALRNALREGQSRGAGLFWTLDPIDCPAVALVLTSPGRVGFLYTTPPPADPKPLLDAVDSATRYALAAGVQFIQALTDPAAPDRQRLLEQAGYQPLAELVHMEADLCDGGALGDTSEWDTLPVNQLDDHAVGQLLRETYRDTLDCPTLAGKRTPADVLASHRNTGRYTPQNWLAAVDSAGLTVGLILVNRAYQPGGAEIVYLGVIPSARRQGIARFLLARTTETLRAERIHRIHLTVDARNAPALRLYADAGLHQTHRQLSHARFATAAATA